MKVFDFTGGKRGEQLAIAYATCNFVNWHGDQLDAYAEEYATYFVEISAKETFDDIYAWAWGVTGMDAMPLGFARDAASNAFHDIDFEQIASRVQAVAQAHIEKWRICE